MTTSTSRTTTTGLREAAAALHDAELAVGQHDDRAAHEALVELARASYRSLSTFERQSLPLQTPAHQLHGLLAAWREELDEMRVQLALAEMEAREAGSAMVKSAERVMGPATERLTGAMRDIAAVLADLRRGLTDRAT